MAQDAFAELVARGLVAEAAGDAPNLVDASDWRAHLLSPKERGDAAQSKHAARLIARQLCDHLPDWTHRDLTTDAAEAVCLGAWAAARLGWRDAAISVRFSNGDPTAPKRKTALAAARRSILASCYLRGAVRGPATLAAAGRRDRVGLVTRARGSRARA